MPDFCEMLPNVTPHNPCRVKGGVGEGGVGDCVSKERVFDDAGTTYNIWWFLQFMTMRQK